MYVYEKRRISDEDTLWLKQELKYFRLSKSTCISLCGVFLFPTGRPSWLTQTFSYTLLKCSHTHYWNTLTHTLLKCFHTHYWNTLTHTIKMLSYTLLKCSHTHYWNDLTHTVETLSYTHYWNTLIHTTEMLSYTLLKCSHTHLRPTWERQRKPEVRYVLARKCALPGYVARKISKENSTVLHKLSDAGLEVREIMAMSGHRWDDFDWTNSMLQSKHKIHI